MESVTVQEILLDEAGKPLIMHNGQYLCSVVSESGTIKTQAVSEDVLISLGFIDSQETPHVLQQQASPSTTSWTEESTRLILDKYSDYLMDVGPMKKFNNKKKMWEQIATDLCLVRNENWTAVQVENRWKTVLKRKRSTSQNNSTSGAKRQTVEYEAELSKIAAVDDSLQPEVLRSAQKVIINPKERPGSSGSTMVKTKNRCSNKLHDMFVEMHKSKEEKKKKRHTEKMELLKQIAKLMQKADDDDQ